SSDLLGLAGGGILVGHTGSLLPSWAQVALFVKEIGRSGCELLKYAGQERRLSQRSPGGLPFGGPDKEWLRELPARSPVAVGAGWDEVLRVVGPAGGARDDVVDVLKRPMAVDAAMALAEGRPVGRGGLAELRRRRQRGGLSVLAGAAVGRQPVELVRRGVETRERLQGPAGRAVLQPVRVTPISISGDLLPGAGSVARVPVSDGLGLAGTDRGVLPISPSLPARARQTERLIAVGLREVGDHLVAAGLAAWALPTLLDGRPTR